ncbi:MAG: hypothetical protein DLM72_21370 [Candidatus Nitrosopolaris wilkensis]|nr:MAG: hypothetical protein DLM72_21370 [Candidatus Nitrosopolaris wilkensis]
MILTKDIASKVLQKNLSELILLASQPIPNSNTSQFHTFVCKIKIPDDVLDYVNLRRERGASANAIVRNLTTYRNRVIVAPSGNYGSITQVVMRKAGSQNRCRS